MPEEEALADPIHDFHRHLDTLLRLGAASGVQVVDRALQRRLEVERTQRRALEDQERQAVEREKAQRELARLLWRRAFDTAWWDQATEEQVARSYEAAFVYAATAPDAADALVRLDEEIDRRHLVGEEGPDESAVAAPDPAPSMDRVRDLLDVGAEVPGTPARHPAGSALLSEDEVATTMAASFATAGEVGAER